MKGREIWREAREKTDGYVGAGPGGCPGKGRRPEVKLCLCLGTSRGSALQERRE